MSELRDLLVFKPKCIVTPDGALYACGGTKMIYSEAAGKEVPCGGCCDCKPSSTKVSSRGCDHKDMAGDTLVEVAGDQRRCSACGLAWRDTDVVIVNDEVG
jgi:hypothetical protein